MDRDQQDVERCVLRWVCDHLVNHVGGISELPKQQPSPSISDLTPEQRKRFSDIVARVIICAPTKQDISSVTISPDIFQTCLQAFARNQPLALLYCATSGEQSERRIEPHAIVIRPPLWFILSHDLEKKSLRTFRMDNIVQAHFMIGHFASRSPDELFGDLQGIRYVADPD